MLGRRFFVLILLIIISFVDIRGGGRGKCFNLVEEARGDVKIEHCMKLDLSPDVFWLSADRDFNGQPLD